MSKRNVSASPTAPAVVRGDLVRVDARVDVLVGRREPAALGPDLGRLGGRQVLDERLAAGSSLNVTNEVAAAHDEVRRVADRREREHVVAGHGLERRGRHGARDEVALDDLRALGRIGEDVPDRRREVGLEGAGGAADDVARVADDLPASSSARP